MNDISCGIRFVTIQPRVWQTDRQTDEQTSGLLLFIIYNDIVHEYTEEYKEKFKKKHEQRIALRHTQRAMYVRSTLNRKFSLMRFDTQQITCSTVVPYSVIGDKPFLWNKPRFDPP